MEEILASIRRIIADDDATRGQTKEATAAPAPPVEPARATAAVQVPPPMRPATPSTEPKKDIDSMIAQLNAAPGLEHEPPFNVLDLTEEMTTIPTASPVPGFRTIDGHPDVVFNDTRPEPAVSRVVEQARRQFQSTGERPLISASTSTAVDSAFNALAHTVLDHNARTLEDLVREMLRPLLKNWLDDNLPGMVERMVRAEIERVSRGRS